MSAGAVIDRLLALDAAARTRLLQSLPPGVSEDLLDRWEPGAHRGQLAPPGGWHVWLIRAGRGFGKTRAGAEWISQLARDNPKARIALVSGTIEDARRVTPSAVKRSDGLDADTMDVAGALTGAAIGEADLLAGRWDGARVVLFAADWTGAGQPVPLGAGTIGSVETKDDGFTAELQGIAAALARPVVEETSAQCRAELGDARCRVPMAGRRRFARIVAADGAALTLDAREPGANAWGWGLLRWLGGGNSGLESAVAASDGATVTLRRPPAYAPEAGTLVEVVEGCDKSFATCRDRFANAVNFRGEPFLPGIDLLTRYPGA